MKLDTRRIAAIALAGVLAVGGVGCASTSGAGSASSSSTEASAGASSGAAEVSASSQDSSSGESETTATTDIDETRYKLDYSNRDLDPSYDAASAVEIALSGTSATSSSPDVAVDGSRVTVSAEGVYVLSGSLDGQVVVNAPEDAKVQLVLSGADIKNTSGSALYVQQADKCFVTLASETENSIADGEGYTFEGDEDEPDAALFSECDLTLQGEGSLTVASVYNDAVKTKDDLVITGGTYGIAAKGDGLVGKDSVKVDDGTITVKTTEGDGIKSSKDDDASKGFVSIDGGTITIDAADKGIKAETYLRVTGGTLDITAADDALHSDGCGRIVGGDVTLAAGDDGFHVEYALDVNDGVINITKSYEGLEGQEITINGGDTNIVASDDAINAATAGSGSDQFGAVMGGDGTAHKMGRFNENATGEAADTPSGEAPAAGGQTPPDLPSGEVPSAGSLPSGESPAPGGQGGGRMGGGFGGDFGGGGGMMGSDENCVLTINGGTLTVDAGGDGLDSNGSIVMNGGTVYVNGPTSSGDGALDCGTTITANGGTLIAVGSVGMAEGFTDGTQPFAQVNMEGSAGVELQVTDGAGAVIASFTPTKAYQNVVVTAPAFNEGTSYKLIAGATSTDFTASTTASAQTGFGGNMGGMGGQGGPRGGGQAPNGAATAQ